MRSIRPGPVGHTEETQAFDAQPASVSAARAFVRQFLDRLGLPVDSAVLVVGELASNAVRHAETDYEVTVRVDADGIMIAVADGVASVPTIADLPRFDGGLGLHVVRRLSRDWGSEQTPNGKRIWARLDAHVT
jgi:anti-sigma regulatory factor (Ser/Thr protein kinase)